MLVGEDADQATPDEALQPGGEGATQPVAEEEWQPERQRDPEQVGAIDQAQQA